MFGCGQEVRLRHTSSQWVRYPHRDRLTSDNLIHVGADPRFSWVPDIVWHILVHFFASLALKVGFEVRANEADSGYRVGFLPKRGEPLVFDQVQHAVHYWMMIGGTSCQFFAINRDDYPIPLRRDGNQPTRVLPEDALLL